MSQGGLILDYDHGKFSPKSLDAPHCQVASRK